MGVQFMPVETFDAEVNGYRNHYIKGAVYTIHDTPQHGDLARQCKAWLEARRIIIVGETGGPSLPDHITQHR